MKQAFEQALTELGIPRGGALMVHSDAMVVAQFAGMGNAAGIAAFWTCLEQWLGGHLLVPTFSYSPMADECFDPAQTPSKVGLMTELFRQREGVVRTRDPVFSMAISGPQGPALVARECHDCFGQESPFGWLAEQDGWLLVSGVPQPLIDRLALGADEPLDARLRAAGADLRGPAPVQAAFDILAGYVERLEALAG